MIVSTIVSLALVHKLHTQEQATNDGKTTSIENRPHNDKRGDFQVKRIQCEHQTNQISDFYVKFYEFSTKWKQNPRFFKISCRTRVLSFKNILFYSCFRFSFQMFLMRSFIGLPHIPVINHLLCDFFLFFFSYTEL